MSKPMGAPQDKRAPRTMVQPNSSFISDAGVFTYRSITQNTPRGSRDRLQASGTTLGSTYTGMTQSFGVQVLRRGQVNTVTQILHTTPALDVNWVFGQGGNF